MNLDRVTITGADDSVRPEDLIELSRKYPFVEHGILVSKSNCGSPRFPSMGWIAVLQAHAHQDAYMKLSLHVCGHWVRQLMLGEDEIPRRLLWYFQRIQLNFHGQSTPIKPLEFAIALNKLEVPVIFQVEGFVGEGYLEDVYTACEEVASAKLPCRVLALFDASGGAGILPEKWPEPFFYPDDNYFGYAGGLGPDNLEEQLPLIAKAAKGARFWIDMETKVRSADDQQFDLTKVERCLEICKPHIKETT